MRLADLGQCQAEVFNSWRVVFHLPASPVLVAREVSVETPPAPAPQELWGLRRHLTSCVATECGGEQPCLDLFIPSTKHCTLAVRLIVFHK